jgi:putative ABC transport system substrate-binding protein
VWPWAGHRTGRFRLRLGDQRHDMRRPLFQGLLTLNVIIRPIVGASNARLVAALVSDRGLDDMRLHAKLAHTRGHRSPQIVQFASQRVDAVIVTADPLFNNHRAQVLSLAASQSLPAIYQWREFTDAGGLMSYGPSITAAYHHAGVDAGLILRT